MNKLTSARHPFELFETWFSEAKQQDPDYHHGMNIATVDEHNRPSTRVVFLKEFDSNGFVFYTNYQSRKGQALANNPYICANFWWSAFERQVRIEGHVDKVSAEQSDEYFYSRAEGSQLAAICSQQSQPISSLEELDSNYKEVQTRFSDQPTQRPPHWGGYRITPSYIEFWQGLAFRLHHRRVFELDNNGEWNSYYIQP